MPEMMREYLLRLVHEHLARFQLAVGQEWRKNRFDDNQPYSSWPSVVSESREVLK